MTFSRFLMLNIAKRRCCVTKRFWPMVNLIDCNPCQQLWITTNQHLNRQLGRQTHGIHPGFSQQRELWICVAVRQQRRPCDGVGAWGCLGLGFAAHVWIWGIHPTIAGTKREQNWGASQALGTWTQGNYWDMFQSCFNHVWSDFAPSWMPWTWKIMKNWILYILCSTLGVGIVFDLSQGV